MSPSRLCVLLSVLTLLGCQSQRPPAAPGPAPDAGTETATDEGTDHGGDGEGDDPAGDGDGDGDGDGEAPPVPTPRTEAEADAAYARVPVALAGRVVDLDGRALADARLTVDGASVTAGADGAFVLQGLPRRNALLHVEAAGHRPRVLAVELRRPLTEPALQLGDVALAARTPGSVRMLFAGDVALGRRFLDVDGTTPRDRLPDDTPGALIQVSDPDPGTRAVFQHVRPYFQAADYRVVNLETPVTDAPATPHPSKDYVFFTLPGSLPALRWLGVDYAGQGNNHVYDYLAAGLSDTLEALDAAGLARSGAGASEEAAFAPHRVSLGGTPYSFVSATSISGDEHASSYVATADKGGAADLRDEERVRRVLAGEKATGRVPVALLHVGLEYSERPGAYAAERMREVAAQGAALVVAHHPHTPQGLARAHGVLIAQSLGNLAFDQDRVETMLGLLAEVDLEGASVRAARLVPVYLEDYRPRPVTGELAERMLRRMADLSREGGVALVPGPSDARVLGEGLQSVASRRVVEVPVTVGAEGWAVVDLRGHRRPGESLGAAALLGGGASGARLRAGRDVLEHGDFEDPDVDGEQGEASRWDLGAGGASALCRVGPHRGVAALCQRRAAGAGSEALAAFRNRVRVPGFVEGRPNKRLTLVGWARGDNAGVLRVVARYAVSEGEKEFGAEEVWRSPGGTFGWTQFGADLHLPEDPPGANAYNAPWALRLFLSTGTPRRGEGQSGVDDLAVVAWERQSEVGKVLSMPTPNARDFVRVEAPAGEYTVKLTLEAHRAP